MPRALRAWSVASSVAFLFTLACSEADTPADGGPSTGAGGYGVGGDAPGAGGYGVGGVSSGGTASGGSLSSGGAPVTGGSFTGGAASGGDTASGGVFGAGGSGTGGLEGAGGSLGIGGSLGSGGAGGSLGAGGSTGSGGAGGTGGVTSAGGSGGQVGAGGSGGGSGQPVFHVFLLLGQSNMAGYPKALAADKTENPRIKVLGFDACAATGRVEGQWDTAAPPLHECWNAAIGPGDYFAKTLLPEYPSQDTIGLVPAAISGEKIETFMKVGGAKWNWVVSRAKAAQNAGGVIEGILFHQGESNCGDSAWPGKVKTLVTDLRTELGIGNVPFLAGELLYTGGCSQHNPLVNQLPGQITNAHVVSAQGLTIDPADTWNVHFGHDAQVTFGKRYAEKMITALGL